MNLISVEGCGNVVSSFDVTPTAPHAAGLTRGMAGCAANATEVTPNPPGAAALNMAGSSMQLSCVCLVCM